MAKIDFTPHEESKPSSGIDFTPHEPEAAPGLIESGLRGGLQGLTSGFSDELLGGVQAAGSAVANLNPDLENLKAKYQQFRDLERKRNEVAQQANPTTYMASDLAGAIGQGFALPIAGPLAKGANLGSKLLHGASIGLVGGGLAGAGHSTANNTSDLVKDIGQGSLVGAATGGALQGAVEGGVGLAKGLGNGLDSILSRFKPTQIISKATKKGLEGTDLTSLKRPLEDLGSTAEELASHAIDVKSGLSDLTDADPAQKAIINKTLSLMGLNTKKPFITNNLTGEEQIDPRLLGKVQQLIKDRSQDTIQGQKAKNSLDLILDNLEAEGIDTSTLKDSIKSASENFDIAKDINVKSLHSLAIPIPSVKNIAWLGNLLGTKGNQIGEGLSKASNAVIGGEAQNRASSLVNKEEAPNKESSVTKTYIPENHSVSVNNNSQYGSNVYDTSSANLSGVVTQLAATPGMEYKAKSLQKALDDGDTNQKNAIVFTLMQNPGTRKLFQKAE